MARDQRGFTLVELLVVIVGALVVAGAAMSYLLVSSSQENAISSRAVAARGAELALQQLTHDLNQAMTSDASGNPLHVSVTTAATTPPTTLITFSIPQQGTAGVTPQTVTWTCQGSTTTPGACTRNVASNGAATTVTGFEGIAFTSASGATLTPPITDPTYLGISLTVGITSQLSGNATSASPSNVRATSPITLVAGIDLRNVP